MTALQRLCFLFAYGTLIPGLEPPSMTACVTQMRVVGPGRVKGRLHDTGSYPAAVLDESASTWIVGEVLELPELLLAELDAYEGYDPLQPRESIFVRVRCKAEVSCSDPLDCWIYEYNRDPLHLPIIPDGDYRAHLAGKGRASEV